MILWVKFRMNYNNFYYSIHMFAASNSMECTLLSVLVWTFQNFNDYTHINNLLDDFSAECDDYPPPKTGKLYNDQHSITRCFVAYSPISSSFLERKRKQWQKIGEWFCNGFRSKRCFVQSFTLFLFSQPSTSSHFASHRGRNAFQLRNFFCVWHCQRRRSPNFVITKE